MVKMALKQVMNLGRRFVMSAGEVGSGEKQVIRRGTFRGKITKPPRKDVFVFPEQF